VTGSWHDSIPRGFPNLFVSKLRRHMCLRASSWWSPGFRRWLRLNRDPRSLACCWSARKPRDELVQLVEMFRHGSTRFNQTRLCICMCLLLEAAHLMTFLKPQVAENLQCGEAARPANTRSLHATSPLSRVDQGVNCIASGSGRDRVAIKTAGDSWHAAYAAFQLFPTVSTVCYFQDVSGLSFLWCRWVASQCHETSQLLHLVDLLRGLCLRVERRFRKGKCKSV
jgi:hypothetical protein